MPMVADGRGVGVKNRENLPTSLMDGPLDNWQEIMKMDWFLRTTESDTMRNRDFQTWLFFSSLFYFCCSGKVTWYHIIRARDKFGMAKFWLDLVPSLSCFALILVHLIQSPLLLIAVEAFCLLEFATADRLHPLAPKFLANVWKTGSHWFGNIEGWACSSFSKCSAQQMERS